MIVCVGVYLRHISIAPPQGYTPGLILFTFCSFLSQRFTLYPWLALKIFLKYSDFTDFFFHLQKVLLHKLF